MSLRMHATRWTILVTALLIGLISGCTTTSLVNLWRDPHYPGQPLRNVMVVTLRKDAASRRIWEDGLVATLKEHGVAATPSYELFPRAVPDTDALIDAVRSRGFDAVLIAHQAPTETVTRWVPGYVTVQPLPIWYGGPWRGHYAMYYRNLYAPGYLETSRVIRYEIEVWMTENGGRLVWLATTASLNPTSSRAVNREIADQIIPELLRQGVVAGR